MKRIISILIPLLMGFSVMAQDGLKSAAIFNGEIVDKEGFTESLVSGEKLRSLSLNLFHSIRFSATEEQMQAVSDIVLKDVELASNKEVEMEGSKVIYLLSEIAHEAKDSEFLCMQSKKQKDGTWQVMIIYMKGQTTISSLKNKLAKK